VLDLRQFHVLRAIAREGSLAAAARSLHYGQPTISHHLAALENHVGARLVSRGPKGAELTDIGALFLEHVEPILNQIEAAEREVRGRLKHGVSTLRVGTFATAGARILPTALRGVISGSGIPVELFEDEPYELLRRLREGRLNCALTYELSNAVSGHNDDLAIQDLFDDPYWLLLPKEHRFADQRTVDLTELTTDEWIFSQGSHEPSDRALVAACEAAGFRPKVMLRSDDYRVVQGFVASGSAVALVPEMAIDPGHDLVVRRTLQDVGARKIQFATTTSDTPPIVAALGRALAATSRQAKRWISGPVG